MAMLHWYTHIPLLTLKMWPNTRDIYRGDDFPFQKIAFSVWENSEFSFKGLSKWKFRLAVDTVHKNSVYKRNTNYESGYFQRVTWSVSHCDIACKIRLRCEIEWFMCIAEQAGLISHTCILCRECLAWIARCDDWTENWSTYVTITRVRLQKKYFCTHFLCAPQDWCKRSPLHCWNDIQCTVAMIAIHAQAMVTLHVHGS